METELWKRYASELPMDNQALTLETCGRASSPVPEFWLCPFVQERTNSRRYKTENHTHTINRPMPISGQQLVICGDDMAKSNALQTGVRTYGLRKFVPA